MADKIYDPTTGVALTDWLARCPRPLVFTNGCFDILHRGHIDCLTRRGGRGRGVGGRREQRRVGAPVRAKARAGR